MSRRFPERCRLPCHQEDEQEMGSRGLRMGQVQRQLFGLLLVIGA